MTRIRKALSGDGRAQVPVRETMLHAHQSRTRIELRSLRSPTGQVKIVIATIEQVLEESLIITQPVVDGAVYPLGRFESYLLSVTGPQGKVSGETRVLARRRIRSGGESTLYGYELAMPEVLHITDPRTELRLLLGNDEPREVELRVLGRTGPILGLVEDLSPSGARIQCRNADAHLRRHRQAHIELELPEPIGTIREVVNTADIDTDPETGEVMIRVVFEQKKKSIDDALREARRKAMRRSA